MLFPVVKSERLYQKIANVIMERITDGAFKPGDFLPPERELARQLGVSRASLREALVVLEISGWIEVQSGNGIRVAPECDAGRHKTHSLDDILQARELVDCECAKRAAQAVCKETADKLSARVEAMEQAIARYDISGFYSLDKHFHLGIAGASGNNMLYEFSRLLWSSRVSIPYVGLEGQSADVEILRELNRQHRVIAQAISRGDAQIACNASKDHLIFIAKVVQ